VSVVIIDGKRRSKGLLYHCVWNLMGGEGGMEIEERRKEAQGIE
jgi:hypothetical protein